MAKEIKDKDFKIKFDSNYHEVDANVLINSLIHTTSIIHEINDNLDSDKKIDVKVKALEKGSFLVHLELFESVVESSKTLLTKENAALATTILGALVSMFKIRQFLKSSKPKKIEEKGGNTYITSNDGSTLVVNNNHYHIYDKSQIIQDAVAHNFDTLENDPSINGFEITDKNENPLVRVDREEFDELSTKSIVEDKNSRTITEATTITIVRVSFERNLKWDFLNKGIKFAAKVTDPDFYDKIDKGMPFSKGDNLDVDLEIHQSFDETVDAYINKTYVVSKIKRHLPRGSQSKIDFR